MNINRGFWQKLLINFASAILVSTITAGIVFYIYDQWRNRGTSNEESTDKPADPTAQDGVMPARVSAEARKNLGVIAQAVLPKSYYRGVEIPGMVVDRPGVSDRGVAAPIAGVVSSIHAFPGSTVLPKSPLFSLRLVSDAIHNSQLELFKATKEMEIARQQKQRLEGLAASGGVPGVRMIELENEIQRLEINAHGFRQNLAARGFSADQIAVASQGEFVREITVYAPVETSTSVLDDFVSPENTPASQEAFAFEFQTLNVALGQQVEAGMILCVLADHRSLMIEGRGFRKDLSAIQQAAATRFPVDVTFESTDVDDYWPSTNQTFYLEHIANVIDPISRTFGFYLPLENQWRSIVQNDQTRLIWRFRPGDRVRIFVAVDLMDDVFVLPLAAVVREGGEAFVFRQNGDLFDRISVHVLHEDSRSVVIANDGKLRRNSFIAMNVAASLNRILKAQMASGQPTNLHVHADGTVHAAH